MWLWWESWLKQHVDDKGLTVETLSSSCCAGCGAGQGHRAESWESAASGRSASPGYLHIHCGTVWSLWPTQPPCSSRFYRTYRKKKTGKAGTQRCKSASTTRTWREKMDFSDTWRCWSREPSRHSWRQRWLLGSLSSCPPVRPAGSHQNWHPDWLHPPCHWRAVTGG